MHAEETDGCQGQGQCSLQAIWISLGITLYPTYLTIPTLLYPIYPTLFYPTLLYPTLLYPIYLTIPTLPTLPHHIYPTYSTSPYLPYPTCRQTLLSRFLSGLEPACQLAPVASREVIHISSQKAQSGYDHNYHTTSLCDLQQGQRRLKL